MVPADILLLLAAALALVAVWIRNTLPPWVLLAPRVLAYLLFILGIVGTVFSLVDIYMVSVDHVTPGEPMYLDELAYPVRGALLNLARSVAFLVLAFFYRDYARRRRPPARS